ncbi:histidine phosphatase family protein [Aquibium sp. LZ166]|uniref:Histidine phosphatase family protein n=1 Tax=Aquibium pacificus TaxID=3153579 RepID=A0ABV3SQQ8_9HYPH
MGRLYLLRHARAAWAEPGTRDFDRPLTDAGRLESEGVGAFMASRSYQPDIVICSPALRAVETWQGLAGPLGRKHSDALLSQQLYSTDATGYLAIVREKGGTGSLLIVGHNPMIEDLAIALCSGREAEPPPIMAGGFPTAGLAVLSFQTPLSAASPGAARLDDFLGSTPS